MTRSILKLAAVSLALSSFVTDASAQGLFGRRSRSNEATPAATAVPARSSSAKETPPADLDTALVRAQLSRRVGDFAEATKILSQLVLFAPDDPRVMGEYGKTLAAQGRSDDALAFLERAIQLNPSEWSFHSALGVAHDQKGEYQLAQVAYGRALSLKPGESAVLNNAALSYLQSGDLDTAERMAREAEATSTDKARVQQTLALVERLKATRPQVAPAYAPPVEPMPAPVQPALAPEMVASVAPPPGPPTVITPEPLREESMEYMDYSAPMEFTAPAEPIITNTPVASNELPPLEEPWMEPMVEITPAAPTPPSALALLQADPTVRMQAVPKDDLAGPVRAREPIAESPAPQRQASAAPPPAAPRQLSVGTNARQPAPAPRTAQAAPAPKPPVVHAYYVQAGAFATEDRADKLAASLGSMGARVSPTSVGGKSLYRVRIGPFKDEQQANDALGIAKSMGHTDVKVVTE
jgi:Flp pilus assembly protein TadD/cell division septation protein DedD